MFGVLLGAGQMQVYRSSLLNKESVKKGSWVTCDAISCDKNVEDNCRKLMYMRPGVCDLLFCIFPCVCVFVGVKSICLVIWYIFFWCGLQHWSAATDDLTSMTRQPVYMENLKEGRLVHLPPLQFAL